jgi:hypothetical protein
MSLTSGDTFRAESIRAASACETIQSRMTDAPPPSRVPGEGMRNSKKVSAAMHISGRLSRIAAPSSGRLVLHFSGSRGTRRLEGPIAAEHADWSVPALVVFMANDVVFAAVTWNVYLRSRFAKEMATLHTLQPATAVAA